MRYRGLLCIVLLLILNSGCRDITPSQALQRWATAVVQARHNPAACHELVSDSVRYICGNIAQLSELSISAVGDDRIEIKAKIGAELTPAHYEAVQVQLHQGKVLTFSGFRPLWLIEPVRITTFSQGAVVAGEQVDNAGYIAQVADGAMTRLAAVQLGPLLADPGPVVIVVPATRNAWQLLLPAGTAVLTTAAFAWPFGRTADAAVHVVMSPVQQGTKLEDVLAHELVHVLTKSCSWTTTWVTEGLATYLTKSIDGISEELRQQLEAGALPAGLPTNEQIKQASTMVPYNQAAIAVSVLIEHVGWGQARDVLLQWAHGQQVGTVTLEQEQQWYLEALDQIVH